MLFAEVTKGKTYIQHKIQTGSSMYCTVIILSFNSEIFNKRKKMDGLTFYRSDRLWRWMKHNIPDFATGLHLTVDGC